MSGLAGAVVIGAPAGVIATLVMDVGGAMWKAVGAGSGLPPAMFSRWVGHMLRGNFVHRDIRLAADLAPPMPVVVAIHYAIGAVLGIGFVLLAQAVATRPLPASVPIVYGVATTVFAALWMFPTMGWGLLGLAAPPELDLLRTTLFKHLMYGVGLWAAWHLLAARGA